MYVLLVFAFKFRDYTADLEVLGDLKVLDNLYTIVCKRKILWVFQKEVC